MDAWWFTEVQNFTDHLENSPAIKACKKHMTGREIDARINKALYLYKKRKRPLCATEVSEFIAEFEREYWEEHGLSNHHKNFKGSSQKWTGKKHY